MKFYIQSLGCPKNLVDSEEVVAFFFDHGSQLVYEEKTADILILNTCAFIEASRKESFSQIERLLQYKTAQKKLFVMGCLPQMIQDELLAKYPQIDGIMGVNNLRQGIKKLLAGEKFFFGTGCWPKNSSRAILTLQHSVYLKIAEGCNHHCAFCTIPLIRGKYRSRTPKEIILEAESLVANGAKEINLIAQDTTAYGSDLANKVNLAKLLQKLAQVGAFIRVMYMYPSAISDELLTVLAQNSSILPYFDLPLQHYSNNVLRRMNRPLVDLDRLVAKIRELPRSAIRATFICGYPGETDEDHRQLKEFVQHSNFDRLALFAYSAEKGTPAANLKNKVGSQITRQRIKELYDLQSRIVDRQNVAIINSVQTVLFDSDYRGRTYKDAPDIDGCFELQKGKATIGQIAQVVIKKATGYKYYGELLK